MNEELTNRQRSIIWFNQMDLIVKNFIYFSVGLLLIFLARLSPVLTTVVILAFVIALFASIIYTFFAPNNQLRQTALIAHITIALALFGGLWDWIYTMAVVNDFLVLKVVGVLVVLFVVFVMIKLLK